MIQGMSVTEAIETARAYKLKGMTNILNILTGGVFKHFFSNYKKGEEIEKEIAQSLYSKYIERMTTKRVKDNKYIYNCLNIIVKHNKSALAESRAEDVFLENEISYSLMALVFAGYDTTNKIDATDSVTGNMFSIS